MTTGSAPALRDGASASQGRRALWAWALYDWGNSAFATTVMAGFFPIFFKQYWSAGSEVSRSTFHLGAANSAASVAVAIAAPALGAIADRGAHKKRLLLVFAVLGAVMTSTLYFVPKGDFWHAALCYALATVGFEASLVFYDSLLVSVAPPEQSDRASAFGYALGYLGGGLLFALNVAMALKPGLFGLTDAAQGVRVSFLMVGAWWALFTLPLLRYVPEPRASAVTVTRAVREGLAQLRTTLRRIAGMREVWRFLIAYWLYIDGVGTIVMMAVDYGLSLGFRSSSLTLALLITQFVGFPAALVFGRLGAAIGSKRAVLIGLCVYIGVTLFGYRMHSEREFYALAAAIGLVQGGVQSLSRALYSRLIPRDEAAEFFGFYNMLGKFAAILGPALMGWVSLQTGSARQSILSITLLFAAGGALLLRVQDAPHGSAAISPPAPPV
jgi:UMF1 family MFS transporter